MNYLNEKNIKKIVFASSIILVTILSSVFVTLYSTEKYLEFEQALPQIEKDFIDQQKNLLQYAVNLQIDQINFRRTQIKNRLEEGLESRVNEAKAIAENLYLESRENDNGHNLKSQLLNALRPIKFNQQRGYFFVLSMDGVYQLYPPDPTIEGKHAEQVLTGEKLQVVYNMIDMLRQNDSGFIDYNWPVPGGDPGKLYKKISFVTFLKSYDWFIGAGEYYEDFGNMTKESIVTDIVKSMGEAPQDYFFIYRLHNIEGGEDFATMLVNPNRPDLIGTRLSDDYRGAHGKEFRKAFLRDLREKGESYVTYWYKKAGEEEAKQKLSYFKLYPEWNWVVAKGVYLDDLDKKIALAKGQLEDNLKYRLIIFCLLFFLAIAGVVVLAHYFTKGINSIFIDYKNIQEQQQQELESVNKYLHKRATTDTLTELFNRQHFNERFGQELMRTERYKHRLSLIFFDIDHFKQINDNFGHLAGDNVLKELAMLTRLHVRQTDILARWGGEEFVILVLKAGEKDTCNLAEKMCQIIALHKFSLKQQITCSFGVTAYVPGESDTEFINRADQALYRAKETGRNKVVFL